MYENGRKLNRHAHKEIHRKKTKRRFTPLEYSSYESYIKEANQWCWFSGYKVSKRIENGWIPFHLRWWNGHDSRYPWKKNLKVDAHSKERAHYRDQLAHYDIEEDNIDMPKKFSDPWCWD